MNIDMENNGWGFDQRFKYAAGNSVFCFGTLPSCTGPVTNIDTSDLGRPYAFNFGNENMSNPGDVPYIPNYKSLGVPITQQNENNNAPDKTKKAVGSLYIAMGLGVAVLIFSAVLIKKKYSS